MRRIDPLLIGLPLIYLIGLLPGAFGMGSLYQASISHSGAEVLNHIGLLTGRAALMGLVVGLLRARLLTGHWGRHLFIDGIKLATAYGVGFGLGLALFSATLLMRMAAWGYPIHMESFGSGMAFVLPGAMPLAGFLAGGFDAALNDRELGLTSWKLKGLWAVTGLVGFSAALFVGDVLRGLPIGVMVALTIAKMRQAGVMAFYPSGSSV